VAAWRRSFQDEAPDDQGAIELEAIDQPLPRPTLTPEYRVRLTTPAGAVVLIPVESEASGVEVGKRLRHSAWAIERRMTGPWVAMAPTVRTVTTLQPTESPGALNGQGA